MIFWMWFCFISYWRNDQFGSFSHWLCFSMILFHVWCIYKMKMWFVGCDCVQILFEKWSIAIIMMFVWLWMVWFSVEEFPKSSIDLLEWFLLKSNLRNTQFGSFKFISFGIWFSVGIFNIYWTLNFSSLAWIMYFIVITVASVVYMFSFFYLADDPHLPRFFMYLLLFTFFMLLLIVGDNLLLVFWGWEGVGLCSYLLINFWYSRINANKAALKAVFVNKISDLFLFFGIILVINEINTAELPVFFSLIPFLKYKTIYFGGISLNFLNIVALLFLGARKNAALSHLHGPSPRQPSRGRGENLLRRHPSPEWGQGAAQD